MVQIDKRCSKSATKETACSLRRVSICWLLISELVAAVGGGKDCGLFFGGGGLLGGRGLFGERVCKTDFSRSLFGGFRFALGGLCHQSAPPFIELSLYCSPSTLLIVVESPSTVCTVLSVVSSVVVLIVTPEAR